MNLSTFYWWNRIFSKNLDHESFNVKLSGNHEDATDVKGSNFKSSKKSNKEQVVIIKYDPNGPMPFNWYFYTHLFVVVTLAAVNLIHVFDFVFRKVSWNRWLSGH